MGAKRRWLLDVYRCKWYVDYRGARCQRQKLQVLARLHLLPNSKRWSLARKDHRSLGKAEWRVFRRGSQHCRHECSTQTFAPSGCQPEWTAKMRWRVRTNARLHCKWATGLGAQGWKVLLVLWDERILDLLWLGRQRERIQVCKRRRLFEAGQWRLDAGQGRWRLASPPWGQIPRGLCHHSDRKAFTAVCADTPWPAQVFGRVCPSRRSPGKRLSALGACRWKMLAVFR
mmetsp:Transcript_106052/g.253130  ORF Transcript_106052/g.253130 Transcript_106052/m.253130 type:complete len:229 (-) Transcript_106052:985-1671(-)